jgi:type VI secretion system protein ImpG
MHFSPAQGFTETLVVPKGALLSSIPVDGAQALFSTTRQLTVIPAAVTRVELDEGGASGGALLRITLTGGAPLATWLPDRLSLYFAGEYPKASERRRLVLQGSGKVLFGDKGEERVLPRGAVEPGGLPAEELGPNVRQAGFNDRGYGSGGSGESGGSGGSGDSGDVGVPGGGPGVREGLLALGGRGIKGAAAGVAGRQGFRLVQDYFASPQRFMYAEISGLRDAVTAGARKLTFSLPLPDLREQPGFRPEHLLVNTVPAENIFPHPAIPVTVDHKRIEYLIRPQDYEVQRIAIHRVEGASAVTKDGRIRPYLPFERLAERAQGAGVYSVHRKNSPISGLPEHFLRIVYLPGEKLSPETMSLSLSCHNYGITGMLRTGEINQPTDSSPAMAGFSNITAPTRHCPPAGSNREFWRMLSHLHVNLLGALTVRGFRETLELYASPDDPDTGRLSANRKRVEAFGDFKAGGEDFFVGGRPVRGTLLEVTADSRGFASLGDMRLCGDVLDRFFALFHHLNTYTRLVIREKSSREVYRWPPRLGTRRLV